MDKDQRKRFKWITLYEKIGNAGTVCLKCGISRPTLRKWLKRYEAEGIEGLKDRTKKPHNSPNKKISDKEEQIILNLRDKRKLGARRIQSELKRHHDISLSLATIHKILKCHNRPPLKRKRRNKKGIKRYTRPLPGERVQMDVCKIAPGLYQYTAIDDCTRYRVLGLYPRKAAKYSIEFLEKVVEEMPFSIQRIQTDRGSEFFAYKFQEKLMEYCIKFRPIKPGSPHLNGKVERSHLTDLQEFYAVVDVNSPDIHNRLAEWQHYYNWERPHSMLNGKTPMDRVCELIKNTPLWEEVEANYDPEKERIQDPNYWIDSRLRKLKRSM